MLFEMVTRICVGSGSEEPRLANMFSKTGTTNVTMTSTPMIAMMSTIDRVGDGGADLVLQLGFALVVVGDRRQRAAEEAARSHRPCTMLSISGGKVCGCRASAAENDEPDLDVGLHLHERRLQLLVVGLLDQDRQCAHERQAGVDQSGHLPREDRERPRRHVLWSHRAA